LTLNVINLMI